MEGGNVTLRTRQAFLDPSLEDDRASPPRNSSIVPENDRGLAFACIAADEYG